MQVRCVNRVREVAWLSSLAWLAMTIPAIAQPVTNGSPQTTTPEGTSDHRQHEHAQTATGWQFITAASRSSSPRSRFSSPIELQCDRKSSTCEARCSH